MGMIYRRTESVFDEAGQPVLDSHGKPKRLEVGPFWIKYYRNGRPFRESARTLDKTEARRLLKKREGEVAEGRFRGVRVERTRFEELAEDLKVHYRMHEQRGRSLSALQRLQEALAHLEPVFRGY